MRVSQAGRISTAASVMLVAAFMLIGVLFAVFLPRDRPVRERAGQASQPRPVATTSGKSTIIPASDRSQPLPVADVPDPVPVPQRPYPESAPPAAQSTIPDTLEILKPTPDASPRKQQPLRSLPKRTAEDDARKEEKLAAEQPTAAPQGCTIEVFAATDRVSEKAVLSASDLRLMELWAVASCGARPADSDMALQWFVAGELADFIRIRVPASGEPVRQRYGHRRPWPGDYRVRLLDEDSEAAAFVFTVAPTPGADKPEH